MLSDNLETEMPSDAHDSSSTLKIDIPSRSASPHATNSNPSPASSSYKRPRFTNIPKGYVPGPDVGSSWSASSDKQLGGSGGSDRVFPIRSVVRVDSSQTPATTYANRNSGEMHDYFPQNTSQGSTPPSGGGVPSRARFPSTSGYGEDSKQAFRARQRGSILNNDMNDQSDRKSSVSTTHSDLGGGLASHMHLASDSASERSVMTGASMASRASRATRSTNGAPNAEDDGFGGLVTARFKHIVTAEGHAVITGRDGETLQRCEDEPIHIPGAVQGFGMLIALEELEENQLIVRIVSENSQRMIGYSPQELFRQESFLDILSEEQQENLLDHIDFIRDDEADPAANGPEVFILSIRNPRIRKSAKYWCAMHINPAHPDLIICELELDDDQTHPLAPANSESPMPPEDTLNSKPTKEEFNESTMNSSKPLRVLRSARKRKGEAAAMEVFNIMSQVQEQLADAPNLELFLKILVGVVKELTGFHRVMIYQFDHVFNGRVVTELVDPRATKDLYKGLNFPASDIPRQARDLYKVNKVRMLYDRDLETARLVCRGVEDLEHPLDLSYSYLRAMSPIHIKYLKNMAVRSSMSISINAFGELWGLIACHSYGPKGMRVSFPIRKMCRLVGDTASRNIERLSYASRLQARKLINTVPTEANPSGYIIASSDDLLKLFDADFGLLSIKGETKILGKLEQSQEALAMLEYMRMRRITTVLTSQDIKIDFPDLRYPPGFNVIAGLLLVPLSAGGEDFIVFFRAGQIKEVKWAGNPYEKFVKEGTEGYLEPRKSFKTWSETVIGKCREWTEEQVETAAVLCLVYGKFIEVWRQKEAALQSSQLTRLLLANSAHEVRTPLNAIINYLEIALEGALDQETRDNLAKSHSASKSLIYVINDLLDLTKTEEGKELVKDEVFDLPATIREATDSFKGDAKRKSLEYEVIEHPGVPQFVHGDQRRVRQAVANITANAIQHTPSGWVRVELWLEDISEGKASIEIVIQDSGVGMSNQKLDALFRDLEQVDGDDFLAERSEADKQLSDSNRTLGLGLALVARIIRNMDGQLRLKSEEGKGSRFVIQLPFVLSDDHQQLSAHEDSVKSPSVRTPPPPGMGGEVTLIDKSSSIRAEGISRQRSVEEVTSLHSFKSASSRKSDKSNKSNKSDVDRLIDAISAPVLSDDSEENALQRVNSRDSGGSRQSSNIKGPQLPRRSSYDQPGKATRSKAYARSDQQLKKSFEPPPGSSYVTDSKTPLKAVRIPDEFSEFPPPSPNSNRKSSRVNFDMQPPSEHEECKAKPLDIEHLEVLVAEDDPVNSKIIQKRLEKSGHKVYHTINGEECASAYDAENSRFDVVLMDMQMPIVDGLSATKMIRSYEKVHLDLSPRAALNGRIPIFAVSASLIERERQTYIDAGFDGWILKPIDFRRLRTLMEGIVDDTVRESCLYKAGDWERGGWFHRRQPSALQSSTVPSKSTPVQHPPSETAPEPPQPDKDSLGSSDAGSITPMNERRQPSMGVDGNVDTDTKCPEIEASGDLGPAEERPVEDVSNKDNISVPVAEEPPAEEVHNNETDTSTSEPPSDVADPNAAKNE